MNSGSLTSLCKEVNYTSNKSTFKFILGKKEWSNEGLELIWKVYTLCRFTDYFVPEVRDYFTKGETYRSVSDKHDIPIGTVKNKIYRACLRLIETIGIDVWVALNDRKLTEEEILNYTTIVDGLLAKVRKFDLNLMDIFSVDVLSHFNAEMGKIEVSEDNFQILKDRFSRFSIPANEHLLANMNKHLLNYGLYLLMADKNELNEVDKFRKETLCLFMRIT